MESISNIEIDIAQTIISLAIAGISVWYTKKFEAINSQAATTGKALMNMAKTFIHGLLNAAPMLITLAIARTRFSGNTPSSQNDLFELFMLCTWMSLFVAIFAIRLVGRMKRDEAR